MRPTPCPSRLKELIALANLEPDSEARKNLQAIARAFRAKRQRQKGPDFIEIASPFAIRINLDGGILSGVFDEFAYALDQAESESNVNRIRECPFCSEIFWAGRRDKEACSRHSDRWRKQEQRRRKRELEAKRAKQRARRAEARKTKPYELSKTAAIILEAVIDLQHTLKSIDDYCYMALSSRYGYGRFEGVYNKPTVERCLRALVEYDYLAASDLEDGGLYYTAKNKTHELRREAKQKKCRIRDLVEN